MEIRDGFIVSVFNYCDRWSLIGLDRSQQAWRVLLERGRVSDALTGPCLAELEWLKTPIERH